MIMKSRNYDQEKNNPCLKEANISYKCLSDHEYDKDKCESEIENYNHCKKFWGFVRSDRRRQGIKPYLPEPAERESVKASYMNTFLSQN